MENKSVSITETAPNIKRVDLVDGGSNGLKVVYKSFESIGGVMNGIETQKKLHRPAQREIRNYFGLLKEHLLRCMGFHWTTDEAKEMLMSKLQMKFVVVDRELAKFQIGGTIKVLDEEYTAPLTRSYYS